MLARRRGGLGEESHEPLAPLDLVRPQGTGTMAEGVGGPLFVAMQANGGRTEEEHRNGAAEGARRPVAVGGPEEGGPGEAPATPEGGW